MSDALHILVPIHFAVDYNIRVNVSPDGSGIDTAPLKHSVNPFDEIALEEALRLKEAGKASIVTAIVIGPIKHEEGLRHCLALGADHAVRIDAESTPEPLQAAKLLAAYIKKNPAALVLTGKQSIDDDYGQTGQMLAALLGWPCATFASALTLSGQQLTVTREVDDGLVTAAMSLPAIVTADLRLNTPRYATLPNIMKSKGRPITQLSPADVGGEIQQKLTLSDYSQPSLARETTMLSNVDELIAIIKEQQAAS